MQGILFNHDLGMFQGVVAGTKTETRRLQIEGKKARYKVGEKVFLKEPYALIKGLNTEIGLAYKYTFPEASDKWRNKMFMGEKYARYFIEITEVIPEKLFQITEEGAIAEGVEYIIPRDYATKEFLKAHPTLTRNSFSAERTYRDYNPNLLEFPSKGKVKVKAAYSHENPINSYMSLWAKINGKESLNKNPLVWVYKFKLVK